MTTPRTPADLAEHPLDPTPSRTYVRAPQWRPIAGLYALDESGGVLRLVPIHGGGHLLVVDGRALVVPEGCAVLAARLRGLIQSGAPLPWAQPGPEEPPRPMRWSRSMIDPDHDDELDDDHTPGRARPDAAQVAGARGAA